MKNYNDCHHGKTTRMFLYKQKAKNCETILYTKIQTLFKKLDNPRCVFVKKINTLYVMGFFMISLKLEFLYKIHYTFRYVTFLYKNLDTCQKSRQFVIRFYIQKPGILRYAIFH